MVHALNRRTSPGKDRQNHVTFGRDVEKAFEKEFAYMDSHESVFGRPFTSRRHTDFVPTLPLRLRSERSPRQLSHGPKASALLMLLGILSRRIIYTRKSQNIFFDVTFLSIYFKE